MRVHVEFFDRASAIRTMLAVEVDGSEDYSAVVREVYKTHEHCVGLAVTMVCNGHRCCVMRDGRIYELSEDGRSDRPVSRGKARKLARFFRPDADE